ncbi:MAG: heparinase II/III family protein [Armatimonadota bacterium]
MFVSGDMSLPTESVAVVPLFVMALLLVAFMQPVFGQDIEGATIPRNVPPVKLFDELNYDLPGLADVKAAVEAGNMEAAKRELLEYFRSLDEVVEPQPRPDYDTELADEVLKGRFVWGDTVCYYGPDIEDIEWYRVPEGVDWPLFDHRIGRGTYIRRLGDAYHYTGDEKYARHLIALLMEFIQDCDVEDGRAMAKINNADCLARSRIGEEGLHTQGHPAMIWTLMAAMRRVQHWPRLVQHLAKSEAMTPDALAAILTSLVEHERYILDAVEVCRVGNHGPRTAEVALYIAKSFPQFSERDEWADRATADLMKRYNWHNAHEYGFVYPDGATVEIYPGVARGDYGTLARAMGHLRAMGREIPEQLLTVYERMAQHYAWMIWPTQLPGRKAGSYTGPGIEGRPDIDYIESGGKVGEVPQDTSYPLHSDDRCYAGTYIMRSDWTPEAVALRVRFGPIQYKYDCRGKGDVGEVSVWGHGMHIIPHIYHHPPPGNPLYEYGDRTFAGDGMSHNHITVDGFGQTRYGRVRYIEDPLDNRWITNPVFDYVRGSYEFDPENVKVTHTRAVLFMRPDYFVILDTLDGEGEHSYRMKYQLNHELSATKDGVRATATSNDGPGGVIAVSRDDVTLSIVEGQTEPRYEGWHLTGPETGEPAPALLYTWTEETPSRIETIIEPLAAGQQSQLQIERTTEGDKTVLSIRRGEKLDVITRGSNSALTVERYEDNTLTAAGMVAAPGLQARDLKIASSDPGSAWVKKTADGWVGSSDCGAQLSIGHEAVQTVRWRQ